MVVKERNEKAPPLLGGVGLEVLKCEKSSGYLGNLKSGFSTYRQLSKARLHCLMVFVAIIILSAEACSLVSVIFLGSKSRRVFVPRFILNL